MTTLELTLQHRRADGWPVVGELSRPGELARRCEGRLVFPAGCADLEGFAAALTERLDRPRDYGTLRWERLCAPDGVGGWDFLALDQSTPYSRYLRSLTDRRFPAIGRRDLRALVVLADPPPDNPYGLASFEAPDTPEEGRTAQALTSALGGDPPRPARPRPQRHRSRQPRRPHRAHHHGRGKETHVGSRSPRMKPRRAPPWPGTFIRLELNAVPAKRT